MTLVHPLEQAVPHRRVGLGATWHDDGVTCEWTDTQTIDGQLWVKVDRDGHPELTRFLDIIEQIRVADDTASHINVAPLIDEQDLRWRVVPEEERRRACILARHLIEALTGDFYGHYAQGELNPPSDERYDPTKHPHLAERLQFKADELTEQFGDGYTFKTLEAKLAKLKKQGVYGLVDQRKKPPADPLDKADPKVVAVIEALVRRWETDSTRKLDTMVSIARAALIRADLDKGVSNYQIRRLIRRLGAGRNLDGSARTRGNKAGRPQRAHGRLLATRPGEYVQIDATPLNAWAYDPVLGYVKSEVLSAIDLFDGAVLALRVVTGVHGSRDLGLLMWDVLNPVVRRSAFETGDERVWRGKPKAIVVIGDEDAEAEAIAKGKKPRRVVRRVKLADEVWEYDVPTIAGHPDGEDLYLRAEYPSTVIIDRGGSMNSYHFLGLCASLGIAVLFARPYQGHDKGHIESYHRDLAKYMESIPAYKGAHVMEKGKNPHLDAVLDVVEIEHYLLHCIHYLRHKRRRDGNRSDYSPSVTLSCDEQFLSYLRAGGRLEWPLPPDRVLDFLWREQRQIGDDGVHIDGFVYDSPHLWTNDDRKKTQGDHGIRQWFNYDPNDRSRIYWRDEFGVPHEILRKHAGQFVRAPFTLAAAREARRYHAERSAMGMTDEEHASALAVVIDQFEGARFRDLRTANQARLDRGKVRQGQRDARMWRGLIKEQEIDEPKVSEPVADKLLDQIVEQYPEPDTSDDPLIDYDAVASTITDLTQALR